MLPFDRQRTAADPGALAEAGPPAWLLALERAQASEHRAARALENVPAGERDLAPAARALEAAIGSTLSAIDLREDRMMAIRAAMTSIDATAAAIGSSEDPGLVEALESLRDARTALLIADERMGRVPPELPPTLPDLRVSTDVPSLHTFTRPTLIPTLRVAEPRKPPPTKLPALPKPKDLAELEATMAEVKRRAEMRKEERAQRDLAQKAAAVKPPPEESPPGFTQVIDPAISEIDFLHARTRDCFEEVAMIGNQRAPLLGDPWRTSAVLEKRMLAAIDAVAALGATAVNRIEPLVIDAPAKDPSRGFAATMILGSMAGRDSLAAAERIARHLGIADQEALTQFGAALKLVPHAEIGLALRTLLVDADPLIRALAIDVLGYRDLATDAELGQASVDPSPIVVASALPWLALKRPMDVAAVTEPLITHGDVLVREAAWIAMGLAGHLRCADVLVRELSGAHADRAAGHLALVCEEHDAERLLERTQKDPTRGLINALGWAGSAAAVPPLIAFLEHEDDEIKLAAAYALDRITGARLYDDVEVPPEDVMVSEVEDPDVGEPQTLAREVSDPRDEPSEGAPDTVTLPTTKIGRWTAYWAQRGADYRPTARYRRGHPYTPLVSLWELDGWRVTPPERRMLQRELVIRTGQYVRFDPHDFVSIQEEALKAWEPAAKRAASTPGSFSRPSRR